MVDTNFEHQMWTVPHCWIADTMVVCHRWRFPKGPLQSSKYHSLWWTSCTWCFLAASSEWVASSSHRPDDVNENRSQPNISAVGKYTKTYKGKKGKITISLVSQMILPDLNWWSLQFLKLYSNLHRQPKLLEISIWTQIFPIKDQWSVTFVSFWSNTIDIEMTCFTL